MRILIAGEDAAQALHLAFELESAHEDWSCTLAHSGQEALAHAQAHQVLILDGAPPGLSGPGVLEGLRAQGHDSPPLTVLFGAQSPWADRRLSSYSSLPAQIASLAYEIPRLYPWEQGMARAQGFLASLALDSKLYGYAYLAWMITAVLGNPALLNAVTLALYPQAAQAYGTTPAAVERCVRHAIENLWSYGDLKTLEAYFGQSVDPERGKPTNREFLAMAREHCRF